MWFINSGDPIVNIPAGIRTISNGFASAARPGRLIVISSALAIDATTEINRKSEAAGMLR